MDAGHREAFATVGCIVAGAVALGFAFLLDATDINPDAILAAGAVLAGALVVGLGFAAKVARPRFFLAGLVLAEAAYWILWMAIASWNTAQMDG